MRFVLMKELEGVEVYLADKVVDGLNGTHNIEEAKIFDTYDAAEAHRGVGTGRDLGHVVAAERWECTGCGRINRTRGGACSGCRLSSPLRREL